MVRSLALMAFIQRRVTQPPPPPARPPSKHQLMVNIFIVLLQMNRFLRLPSRSCIAYIFNFQNIELHYKIAFLSNFRNSYLNWRWARFVNAVVKHPPYTWKCVFLCQLMRYRRQVLPAEHGMNLFCSHTHTQLFQIKYQQQKRRI